MKDGDLERFQHIESAFHGALERPEGPDRDAFVASAGAKDPTVSEELRELLEAHARVEAAVPAESAPLPRFGAWQATRVLGRGGMGTVYLADRADGAFQMSAAVKVVPLALASPEIEDRFRRERQFLAMLDHPRIARLLDGGVSREGLPYLVMEFVAGQTIDVYCDQRHLDVRARVALMRHVLEALEYVHSRGVIHRDIKPSNIQVDAAGQPRLLDFGTARLVDPPAGEAVTRSLAFTPHYASPEQARGEMPTAASDIYSAGVLLYKLLTGRLPYQFPEISPSSVAAIIAAADPEPPGLDDGLNAVLAKALQKEPAARYESAAAMAEDLGRWLEGRPVAARSPGSRLRRLFKPGRVMAAAAALVLCAVAAVPLLWKAGGRTTSIVVLPFADLSGDPANQYLADGLTDEITDALVRIKDLRVIARSSAFQFKGAAADVREIGSRLGVAHVLEGSIARTGDRVTVVAHLERVSSNSREWSQTYERDAAELSGMQTDLVERVARTLKAGAVPGGPHAHVPVPEAHRLLMEGRYEFQHSTPEAVARAEADFRRAIALDPRYAPPYEGLAAAIHAEDYASAGTLRNQDERGAAEQWLRKALEIDPELPQARSLMAEFAMQYDWDWKRAETELRRALAGGSSVGTEVWYAFFLVFHGRFAEAEEHLRRAQDLDPFGTRTLHDVALMINLEGRFAEAREIWLRAANLAPAMLAPKIMVQFTWIEEGRPELALPEVWKLKQQFPPAALVEAMAQARNGHRDQALRLMQPFEAQYPNTAVTMQWFALVYAFLGDEADTVKWLDRSADRKEFQVLNVAVHPVFASMRHSPAFQALQKRIGLGQ